MTFLEFQMTDSRIVAILEGVGCRDKGTTARNNWTTTTQGPQFWHLSPSLHPYMTSLCGSQAHHVASRTWENKPCFNYRTSLVAQMVKRLPATWETQVWSPGREDLLERKWQPTPVLLPGKFHGRRSLVGYSLWGRKELDTTEQLHFHFFNYLLVVTEGHLTISCTNKKNRKLGPYCLNVCGSSVQAVWPCECLRHS